MTEGGAPAPDALAALRAVVRDERESDLETWTATGRAGMTLLRDVLLDRVDLGLRDVHPKNVIDGLSAAAAAIAERHPAVFLDVFADPGFDRNGFVLTGLGYVHDARATERLALAARSRDPWLRMDAAIGLGRHAGPVAVQALIALLADAEYLVRYHALRGLAAVGDGSASAPLRSFRGETAVERDLANQALERIEERAGTPPDFLP